MGTRGSWNPCRARNLQEPGGFTLVEMSVVLVFLSLVLGSAFVVLLGVQREYVRQREYSHAQDVLRTAEMAISAVLRSAEADPFETGDGLLDPDPLGNGSFDNLRVKSDYNPADGDFADPLEDVLLWTNSDTLFIRWQAGGPAGAYAAPITDLEFRYYDSQGTEITDPGEIASDARRVRFTLEADKGPGTTSGERRRTWVYLRNRE